MVVVAGYIVVAPERREEYLAGCVGVVEQARKARGCLDFAIGPDLVEPGRINVFERWATREDVEAFRGSGPEQGQSAAMLDAAVAEFDIAAIRSLT
ncbi:MAG TPA: antibiotic biosynthesis monooxygenase family protein [Nocardia sp.]|uniref:putative quinol monooxygenase n=1 Tax=Nocardia TaxID=1817 RepID=UPI0024585D86|nr:MULTISPECIES: antibiotic biosynthesis monooxygenase [Nocardia]HLS77292.1 antibiotic biosynthesis monooxygenase family protein [Nocardia sp.]